MPINSKMKGFEIMLKSGRRPSANKPNGEELVKDYETHTAKELAERYDVSITTIRRWIREERTWEESGNEKC